MNWRKLYNPMVISLLHSPLHHLLVISQQERTWWKNLRGGAPVTIYLQGHLWLARGETFTDTELGASILLQILQDVPAYQRLLHVTLDATGQPENPAALARLAQDHVVVRLRELTERAA